MVTMCLINVRILLCPSSAIRTCTHITHTHATHTCLHLPHLTLTFPSECAVPDWQSSHQKNTKLPQNIHLCHRELGSGGRQLVEGVKANHVHTATTNSKHATYNLCPYLTNGCVVSFHHQKSLNYLDDRPVFDKERACAEAW